MLAEEIRATRDSMRYGFAVGKVRVLETRALDRAAFERLLDAPSLAEQKRLLSESPYGRFLEQAHTSEDVERGLSQALDEFYRFLDEAALPPAVTKYFRLRYDFSNLKAAAKARLLGASMDGLLVEHGSVAPQAFLADLGALPEPLGSLARQLLEHGSAHAAGAGTVSGTADEDGAETRSPAAAMAIDTAVDGAMFGELLSTAQAARSSYLVELARMGIDVANARTLVRGRASGLSPADVARLLIDGGTATRDGLVHIAELTPNEIKAALKSVPSLRGLSPEQIEQTGALDVALDAVLAAALRRGRMGGQVGPEPVIAYVFAREAEVVALRVLLLGRLAGIDNETLRARLRVLR